MRDDPDLEWLLRPFMARQGQRTASGGPTTARTTIDRAWQDEARAQRLGRVWARLAAEERRTLLAYYEGSRGPGRAVDAAHDAWRDAKLASMLRRARG